MYADVRGVILLVGVFGHTTETALSVFTRVMIPGLGLHGYSVIYSF